MTKMTYDNKMTMLVGKLKRECLKSQYLLKTSEFPIDASHHQGRIDAFNDILEYLKESEAGEWRN